MKGAVDGLCCIVKLLQVHLPSPATAIDQLLHSFRVNRSLPGRRRRLPSSSPLLSLPTSLTCYCISPLDCQQSPPPISRVSAWFPSELVNCTLGYISTRIGTTIIPDCRGFMCLTLISICSLLDAMSCCRVCPHPRFSILNPHVVLTCRLELRHFCVFWPLTTIDPARRYLPVLRIVICSFSFLWFSPTPGRESKKSLVELHKPIHLRVSASSSFHSTQPTSAPRSL
ncbi:hypothetical protein H4582DRAFT_953618 [Lactarius indigo]|nr:hypothetical protein H4582DRAFT_953618 [Lactarius indigo]